MPSDTMPEVGSPSSSVQDELSGNSLFQCPLPEQIIIVQLFVAELFARKMMRNHCTGDWTAV